MSDVVQLVSKDELKSLLAVSVNEQPMISEFSKLGYPSLLEIGNLTLQQSLIMNDLFFVLIGLEGNYIRYSGSFDGSVDSQLNGPDYKISRNLNSSLKDITKSIIRSGKMFYALKAFVRFYDNSNFGKVCQGVSGFIRKVLKEYLGNLNVVYQRFQKDTGYSMLLLNNDLKSSSIDLKLKLLYEICHLIYHSTQKRLSENNDFLNFLSNLKQDFYTTKDLDLNSDNSRFNICKGGLVLTIVNQQIQKSQGNPEVLQFLTNLFDEVSSSYLYMLNDWLMNGSIDDPFDEFFIKPGTFDLKYSIRKDGLPKQLEEINIRNKILQTGTYLNIVKDCGILLEYIDLDGVEYYIEKLTDINLLSLQVDHWYSRSNDLIMELFSEGYKFFDTLLEIRDFYFLNNNQFCQLVDTDFEKLKRKKFFNEVSIDFYFFHDTLSPLLKLGELKLEKNNIYAEFEEILNVKPLNPDGIFNTSSYQALKVMVNESIAPVNSDDTSTIEYLINHINFELILPFPLNLILNHTEIIKFQLIFRYLIGFIYFIRSLDQNFGLGSRNLSILNFKFVGLAKKVYSNCQTIISSNFDGCLEVLQQIKNFEQLKSKILDLLDNILLHTYLTDYEYLRILKNFFKVIINFNKFLNSEVDNPQLYEKFVQDYDNFNNRFQKYWK